MKSIKYILGFCLMVISSSVFSQGLQGIVVEKYYSTDAADAANAAANGAVTPLPVGSTVYRVYVDMAAGYKFSQLYGNASHNLTVTSTANFYNDPSYGVNINPGTISGVNIRKNTAMIDSWFTTGGASSGKAGVLKSEDTDGTVGNQQSILANNAGGCFGLPINGATGQDGMLPSTSSTYVAPNSLGLGTAVDVLDQTAGNSILINNGSIAALGGVIGATSSNMVLIGQFTTSGQLSFALNVQLVNISTGVAENYVASNPVSGELTHPSLTLSPNVAPTVSISSPSNGAAIITGTTMTITAAAADANGSVTGVQFFLDGVSLGTDNSSPYTASYVAVAGSHSVYAVATDNDCAVTTSSTNNFTVANNQAPTVTVTAPASAIAGTSVTFSATANDVDGSVAQVEFFVNNVSVGVDNSSPFSVAYTTVLGSGQLVKAVATDNLGLTGTSNIVTMNVLANVPPSVSLTSPLSSASYVAPAVVTIAAAASDSDGSVSQVEFFVNGVSVNVDATAPYTYDWTSTPGTKVFVAKATDSFGAVTTSSSVTLDIADPNALPYTVGNVTQTCEIGTYCVPVAVSVTNPVDNVIGYDVTLNYDATRLTPTGNITVFSNLVNAGYVETANSVTAPGTMNISLYFNGTAPALTEFNGTGNIFCVEFTRLAAFEPIDSASVSVSFLQESYITGVQTRSASAGYAISEVSSNYQGTLRFWSDNSAIAYDAASPNSFLVTKIYGATGTTINNPLAPVFPDVNGVFNHDMQNGTTLSIERDINNLNSVQLLINAADAVLGKTLLLNGAFTPSVYQIIALDVNLDGVVSAGDISQMKQRATLAIGEFQQAWNYSNTGVSNGQASKDWIFVDQTRVSTNPAYQISAAFPANDLVGFSKSRVPVVPFFLDANVSGFTSNGSTCPTIGTDDYKGILLGDVNGSYASYVADGILKTATSDYIFVDLDHATIEGNVVSVPVSFVSNEKINAFDLALGVNENRLNYTRTESVQGGTESESFFNTNDNTFRYSAFNMNNFASNIKTLVVTFETIDGTISEKDFTSNMGLLNGKKAEVLFSKESILSNMVSVYPNPSNGQINVVTTTDGRMDVVDMTGNLVYAASIVKANQVLTVDLNSLSNGVYFVRFQNENSIQTKRVIISK
jgi:Bacterial Ig domain/Secretion system C-terminal sorting domain